uniref:Nucleoprotein n=1 Tax=Syphacia muris TaxID=451379 RepID=A0A0N5AGA5_9BILA
MANLCVQYSHLAEMKSKPTVVEYIYPDLADAREKIYSSLRGTLMSHILIEYAYHAIHVEVKHLKGVLTEDCTSYGHVIGKSRDEITPLSILNVVTTEKPFKECLEGLKTTKGRATDAAEEEVALMAKCLMVYPLLHSTNLETTGNQSMIDCITCSELNPSDDTSGVNTVLHWGHDRMYCKYIAAINMFLCKFPANHFRGLRMCTKTSHLKDYDQNFGCRCKCPVNYTIQSEFILLETLEDEAYRILRTPQEEEGMNPYSYCPYMKEFDLVMKSPYSASANKNLYL